jgi:hypothetical protein
MSPSALIARTAASFGYHTSEARYCLRHDHRDSARWHAKHARSDWRKLSHLIGLPTPKAHRTADSFAA